MSKIEIGCTVMIVHDHPMHIGLNGTIGKVINYDPFDPEVNQCVWEVEFMGESKESDCGEYHKTGWFMSKHLRRQPDIDEAKEFIDNMSSDEFIDFINECEAK